MNRLASSRKGWIMIRTALLLGLVAAGLLPVPASAAVTAYCGDTCSGKDPEQTGCSADARTIPGTRTAIYGTGGESWVEIRWSDTCQTNWARTNASFVFGSVRAIQQTGYTQGYSSNNGTLAWSKMIYSPTLCVKGSINGGWGYTYTPCV